MFVWSHHACIYFDMFRVAYLLSYIHRHVTSTCFLRMCSFFIFLVSLDNGPGELKPVGNKM